MTEHSLPGKSAYPERYARVSERIEVLERELDALYRARAGTMEPDQDMGWCVQCGRNPVWPVRGEDTCRQCIRPGR